MEVTHLQQFDTHAVIGGAKAQAFRMAETAEFFTVLSDTLYSNKKLAVVREVLCNAWDAHIKVKRINTPVRITLTDKELIIEDSGPGIPDNLVVDTYCTYGKSTKVEDEDQTGGFGLGSKAPFAYTSHFTVTNEHAGFKTIYAVSRGSTQTQGKPDIRQMVRIPSQNTGVTVTIPLSDNSHFNDFLHLIEDVARNGEMNVKLNGEKLETFDFSLARKLGFTLLRHSKYGKRVYVRYGSVLYPVDLSHSSIEPELRSLATFTNERGRSEDNSFGKIIKTGYSIILMAPPNSVGVTPSRESLSYTDVTVETIKGLLKTVAKYVEKTNTKEACRRFDRKNGQSAKDLRQLMYVFCNSDRYRPEFISNDDIAIATDEFDLCLAKVSATGRKPLGERERAVEVLKGALKNSNPEIQKIKGSLRRFIRIISTRQNFLTSGYFAMSQTANYIENYIKWQQSPKRNTVATSIHEFRDLEKNLHQISTYNQNSLRVHTRMFHHLIKSHPRLIVCASKAMFERWLKKKRYEVSVDKSIFPRDVSPEGYEVSGYLEKEYMTGALLLTTSKKDPDLIKRFADMLGVSTIIYAEEAKKPVEVETRLFDASKLEVLTTGYRKRFNLKDVERSTEKFDIFIPCKPGADKTAIPYSGNNLENINEVIAYFNKTGRKVGIVLTAVEKEKALKNGLRMLSEVVEEELNRGLKMKNFLIMCGYNKFYGIASCSEHYGSNIRERIIAWMNGGNKFSEEFRRLIVPSIPRLKEEEKDILTLYNAVAASSENFREILLKVKEAVKALPEQATKLPTTKNIVKMFPGIEHIHSPNKFHADELNENMLEMIKFLKKRAQKAAKKENEA